MHPRIEALLAQEGVISSAEHPSLRSSLLRLARSGVLENRLPGVYTAAGDVTTLGWLRAVCAWSAPAGVLHGRSAAGLWLPDLAGPIAFVAHPTLRSRRGVVVSRHVVPAAFVAAAAGLRVATPTWVAVELAAVDQGRLLCEALRRGLVTPEQARAVLPAFAGTTGNAARRSAVEASRDNPWSFAELRLHGILRSAGIGGWLANRPLRVGGTLVVPDIRFRSRLLILEFDGRDSHQVMSTFLADRERQNVLEAAGYVVLRFGWEHLDDPDYIVRMVRLGLRSARPPR